MHTWWHHIGCVTTQGTKNKVPHCASKGIVGTIVETLKRSKNQNTKRAFSTLKDIVETFFKTSKKT